MTREKEEQTEISAKSAVLNHIIKLSKELDKVIDRIEKIEKRLDKIEEDTEDLF